MVWQIDADDLVARCYPLLQRTLPSPQGTQVLQEVLLSHALSNAAIAART